VIATNTTTGCTSIMNGSAGIMEIAQATITKMPVDETVCENGSAVFAVTATGQGLNYAWIKNGVPLVGETTSILAVNGVTMADNGH